MKSISLIAKSIWISCKQCFKFIEQNLYLSDTSSQQINISHLDLYIIPEHRKNLSQNSTYVSWDEKWAPSLLYIMIIKGLDTIQLRDSYISLLLYCQPLQMIQEHLKADIVGEYDITTGRGRVIRVICHWRIQFCEQKPSLHYSSWGKSYIVNFYSHSFRRFKRTKATQIFDHTKNDSQFHQNFRLEKFSRVKSGPEH